MQGRRSVGLLLLLLGTHLYFANEFRAFPNTNVRSRVYLTLSIVDDHSLSIDGCVKRYGPTQDMASHGGRLYTDKAPGYSVLLVPIAWALRNTIICEDNIRGMCIALRVLGLSLPAVVFWFSQRRYFAKLAGDETRGIAIVLAGALGTNFFIYSTQLFSHAAAAMLLFLAYRTAAGALTTVRAFGAALLLGLCFTVDYVTAPAVAIFVAWMLIRARIRIAPISAVLIGLVSVALPWMAYNGACFGSPLSVGFHHHADPIYGEAYRRGLAGIQPPDLKALLGATILPPHGLAFMSPFLLLAPLSWWRMWNDRATRGAGAVCALVCIGTWLFVMTLVDWRGGWSVSVRYLVPVIPFALVGVATAISRDEARTARFVFVAGAVLGIVQTALAAATFPDFPGSFRDPFYDLCIPLLQRGCVNGVIWNSAASPIEVAPFAVLMVFAIGWVACVTPDPARQRRDWRPVAVGGLLAAAQVPLLLWPGYERRLLLADVMSKMGYTCKSDAERAKLHGETLAKQPNNLFELEQLAWIRAASPCDDLRDGPEAVRLAERARSVTRGSNLDILEVLAAAYAEAGRCEDARHTVRQALRSVDERSDSARAARIRERSREYEANRPIRLPKSGR